jgi:hypothetical protein
MLQRLQSVFLFLVFVFTVLFLVFPLGTFRMNGTVVNIVLVGSDLAAENHFSDYAQWFRMVLSVLPLLAMVFTVYIIFQFKKRMHQVKLGKVNMFIHLIILVVSFFYLDQLSSALPQMSFSYGPSVFFPIVSLVLILRANRSIIKDEKMVRAADRIR